MPPSARALGIRTNSPVAILTVLTGNVSDSHRGNRSSNQQSYLCKKAHPLFDSRFGMGLSWYWKCVLCGSFCLYFGREIHP